MSISNKYEALSLFFGDVLVAIVSIWLSLFVRMGAIPSLDLVVVHLIFFLPIFIFLVSSFYLSGLYGKQALILRSRLPMLVGKAEVISGIFAICYFYFLPESLINPKTILLLYLGISYGLELLWRRKSDVVLANRTREPALLVGGGEEAQLLFAEVNSNPRYHIYFVAQETAVQLQATDLSVLESQIEEKSVTLVVADFNQLQNNPAFLALYRKCSGTVKFLPMHKLYEDVFDRIPLSLVGQHWFLENISSGSHRMYEIVKRVIDVISATILGILSLILYPFVFVGIKCGDGGTVFIKQERIGRGGAPITILKFRTMNDVLGDTPEKRITKVGRILRTLRIDELPQLWNVLLGDLSLIGPRPELPVLVDSYAKEIPYYSMRHTVAPGLSGWAQVHQIDPPKFALAIDQTKIKLSYDLYYLKNRSFFLDLIIAFKTIRTLLSRSGI